MSAKTGTSKRVVSALLSFMMVFSMFFSVPMQSAAADDNAPNTGYTQKQFTDRLTATLAGSTTDMIVDGIVSGKGGYYNAFKTAVEDAVNAEEYPLFAEYPEQEAIIEGLILSSIKTAASNGEYDTAVSSAVETKLLDDATYKGVVNGIHKISFGWGLVSNIVPLSTLDNIDGIMSLLDNNLVGSLFGDIPTLEAIASGLENSISGSILESLGIDAIIEAEIAKIMEEIKNANDAYALAFETKAKALIAGELKAEIAKVQSDIKNFVDNNVKLPSETVEVLQYILANEELLAIVDDYLLPYLGVDVSLGNFAGAIDGLLGLGGDVVLDLANAKIVDLVMTEIHKVINTEDGAYDDLVNELVETIFVETGLNDLIVGDNWEYISGVFGVTNSEEIEAMTLETLVNGVKVIAADESAEIAADVRAKLAMFEQKLTDALPELKSWLEAKARELLYGEIMKLYTIIMDALTDAGVFDTIAEAQAAIDMIENYVNAAVAQYEELKANLPMYEAMINAYIDELKATANSKINAIKAKIESELALVVKPGDIAEGLEQYGAVTNILDATKVDVVVGLENETTLYVAEPFEVNLSELLLGELANIPQLANVLDKYLGNLSPEFFHTEKGTGITIGEKVEATGHSYKNNFYSAVISADANAFDTKIKYGYDVSMYADDVGAAIEEINGLLTRPEVQAMARILGVDLNPIDVNVPEFFALKVWDVTVDKTNVTYNIGNAVYEGDFDFDATYYVPSGSMYEITTAVPTLENHTFKGWIVPDSGEVVLAGGNPIEVNGNVVLHAVFERTMLTVTYGENGEVIEVGAGLEHTIQNITVPAADDKVFAGWMFGDTFVQKGDKITVTESVVLVPVFADETITITYYTGHSNNEQYTMDGLKAHSVAYGKNISITGKKPTLALHTFVGWGTEKGGEVVYESGHKFVKPLESMKLYAIWEKNPLVTYHTGHSNNEQYYTEELKAHYTPYGSNVKLRTNKPTRDDYTFIGWGLERDSEAVYKPGAKIEDLEANLNLYAIWEKNPLVTYHTGHSNNEQYYTEELKAHYTPYGSNVKLRTNKPERYGYTFMGWGLERDGEVAHSSRETIRGLTEDLNLYAIWEKNPKVIYRTGHSNNEAYNAYGLTSYLTTFGSNIKVTTTKPERDGYTFMGWGTIAGGDAVYKSKDTIKALQEDLNLYAIWEKNPKVIYRTGYFNNEALTTEGLISHSTTFGGNIKVTNTKPERDGYTFIGWGTKAGGEVAYASKATIKGMEEDLNLYAIWEENPTITYHTGYEKNVQYELVGLTEREVSYGDSAKLARVKPSRYGYTFKGWGTEAGGEVVYMPNAKINNITSDVKLYAIWQSNENVTIKFETNGGSHDGNSINPYFSMSVPVGLTYDTDMIFYIDIIKHGYTLLGWTTDAEGEGQLYNTNQYITINENTTFYAQWEENV